MTDRNLEWLIRDLASTRADSWAPPKRHQVLNDVTKSLEASSSERATLAGMKDINCWSKFGHQRLALVYCSAIRASGEDEEVQKALCAKLCVLLQEAGNDKLTTRCKRELFSEKKEGSSAEQLAMLFTTIVSENKTLYVALNFVPNPDWEVFVNSLLGKDTTASSKDMNSIKPLLQSLDANTWESVVGPAVTQKLKAKPETVIDMVEGMMLHLTPSVIINSKSLIDEFLPVVMKHLKSPKDVLRDASCLILQHIGVLAVQACGGDDAGVAKTTLGKIANAIADTKSLTQLPQRLAVYSALGKIGREIVVTKTEVDTDTASTVLSGLCTPLKKEAKTATDARQMGYEALVMWLVIGKRNGGGSGYDEALIFLRKPIAMGNGPDSLFVFQSLLMNVNGDIAEAIVLDLWKDEKFAKGLDALVTAANKKHASSSSIPQVEGLMAVYLNLMKACTMSKPKVSALVEKALTAGSSSTEKTSFVFGDATTGAIADNPAVAHVLPEIIILYMKFCAATSQRLKVKSTSAIVKAIASVVTHPVSDQERNSSARMEATIKSVLGYEAIGEAIVDALFAHVNLLSLDAKAAIEATYATRKAREDESTPTIKGKGSRHGSHDGMDTNVVRRIAKQLSTCPLSNRSLGKVLVLMHVGTGLKSLGKQRQALVGHATAVLSETVVTKWAKVDDAVTEIAGEITQYGVGMDGEKRIGPTLSSGAHSLLMTLGSIACKFTPDIDDPNDDENKVAAFSNWLCIRGLAPGLARELKVLTSKVEALADLDVGIYRSPLGTLYKEVDTSSASQSVRKPAKGRMTEDEEWEMQVKKELEKNKKGSNDAEKQLSAEDKKHIFQQDAKRDEIGLTVGSFQQALHAIEYLAQSDIEVGNSCLPAIGETILKLAVSPCAVMSTMPSVRRASVSTLTTLATCVYEIDESYAGMMAAALITSVYVDKAKPSEDSEATEGSKLKIRALPSPCEPAATTIFEMDEFQEELSGPSFAFLFPVIQASLLGPRTAPGCEGALRVLERHTVLLTGEQQDATVAPLRVEMIGSVLEVLKHDRAQTFVDPNPYDALVSCYELDETDGKLSTNEMAPLLDDRGSLGPRNCRLASMIALGSVASKSKKIIKNNPLIENRIWLNCFDENDSIRNQARQAWATLHDATESWDINDEASIPAPSPLYSIPLIPLLTNTNKSIAEASAKALAIGMVCHPKSVNKNISKLCSSYIESCPVIGSESKSQASTLPALKSMKPVAAAPKKKATGIPASLKKKTVKKSALQVAGIGQPKKSKKKSSAVASALLKPKQERTLDQTALESQFKTGPQAPPPEKDSPEKITSRLGALSALSALPSCKIELDNPTLQTLTSFLMSYAIADPDEGVKNMSRNALRDVIASYGSTDDAISFLLPHLDKILKTGVSDNDAMGELPTAKIPSDAKAIDRRKEGAVVALGSVALHLKGPENAEKIDATVDMLLASLKTSNEDVQASVADCLAKLMKKGNTQSRIEEILQDLVNTCLQGETSQVRRGGAYGISASVKGSGIATLKKHGIITQLEEACSDGPSSSKEGSLFAMELLCTRLGLLFEPYVIALLPSLLKSFSDSSDHVRKAASNAVGLIMSKLSAHGVKLVMPSVLTAFNDSAWRTKQASIHMLGSMCHLAPKQLAQALPKVVPRLIEAFADTHPKVKSSAQEALDEITTVIRNPEISSLSSVLLKALTEPADHTLSGLESLISTEFLHAIDAPSLALIVPILHRGLRDRAATTKRYGALITGNICTMINDPRDFVPYLPTLIPDLQLILLDPIPDVRSISAKAFGSLTRGLGEEALSDLRPWLVDRLQAEDVSSAERSGAAQGLTEVLIASGSATVETVVLNDILPLKNHPSPSTREGVLWVLTFLPPALGQGFTPMLDSCLPALIGGLSDENEQVREIGLRAGRVIIRSHGRVHYNKILPILEDGMGDQDNRIRLSSLMLVGDLLSMIGGTTVLRTDGDTQDDIRKAEKAQAQLTLTLGIETRNRVLSEIYLARSDADVAVRQGAVQVWKTIVSVTARTLRQILPVLVTRVVTDLASGDIDRTEVAGKCLGDIVSKLGESVMTEIIPVLRDALYEGDNFTRRGVCVGLSEVIESSTKDQINRYLDIVVKVVQDALCDDDESVREMAASTFQKLHSLVGSRAMDEIVPALMVALESGDESRQIRALNGLTGILSFRSRELLPYIIPRLIEEPITTNHAKALGSIASVTGDTIYYHFKSIIPCLMNYLSDPTDDKEREDEVRACARSVLGNSSEAGVNWLISEIASKFASDKAPMRREACWMMETVNVERKDLADFYEQIPIVIRELVHRLNDESTEVLKANQKALTAMSKHVPAEELVKHVEFMRNLIASMVSDARRRKGGVGDGEFLLPGFNIPKGLEPLLPIYQRGILYGTPIIREASASGLGELIALTAPKFLAGPLIIKMTGPLLRIVGDRNPSNVKVAILKTLGSILTKGGPALRAFVPQFQTTFVKALSDPSRQVRVEAIQALGLLMPLSTRVDPLLKELVSASLGKSGATADSVGLIAIQTTALEALSVVLQKGGKKAKLPDSIPSALEASKELMVHVDEAVREASGKALGAACDILGVETAEGVIREIVGDDESSGDVRHGKACAMRRICEFKVSAEVQEDLLSEMLALSAKFLKDDKPVVRNAGCVAIGATIGRAKDPAAALRAHESDLLAIMGNSKEQMETHQSLAKGLATLVQLAEVEDLVDLMGVDILNACLKLAKSGSQRVQFAYNDVLYLALNVADGNAGLENYNSKAMFEDSKQMKGVYSKVLLKIKSITLLDD